MQSPFPRLGWWRHGHGRDRHAGPSPDCNCRQADRHTAFQDEVNGRRRQGHATTTMPPALSILVVANEHDGTESHAHCQGREMAAPHRQPLPRLSASRSFRYAALHNSVSVRKMQT
jgi:hypothetical protein